MNPLKAPKPLHKFPCVLPDLGLPLEERNHSKKGFSVRKDKITNIKDIQKKRDKSKSKQKVKFKNPKDQ